MRVRPRCPNAISQENVEVVRRGYEAFNRRDLDAIENHPDVEVDWSRSRGVEAGVYRGREAANGFWSTFHDTFDRVVAVPEQFIEHGDYVIVLDRTCLLGRDGIEVEARNVSLVTVRHGQILRWRLYQEKAEALKAMGLRD
jgi:ketosteroid isomerase-like protein